VTPEEMTAAIVEVLSTEAERINEDRYETTELTNGVVLRSKSLLIELLAGEASIESSLPKITA
jgi:hypothetical protein